MREQHLIRLMPARSLLALVALTIGLGALAAEDAPREQAIGRVVIASGDRLIKDFQGSIYAMAWNDPIFDQQRAQATAALAFLHVAIGMDPLELVAHIGPAEARLDGIAPHLPQPSPVIRATCVVTPAPSNLRTLITASGQPASVPGADYAITLKDTDGSMPTLAMFGGQAVFAMSSAASLFPPPAEPKADLVIDVALSRLCAAEAAVTHGEQADQLTAIAAALASTGMIHYEATLVPEGVQERLVLPRVAGLKAVDRSTLESLPATTLVAFAVGLDGPGAWETYHDQLLGAIAARLSSADHKVSPTEAQSQCDALLALVGVPLSLGQLIQGFDGTLLIAVGQSLPVPSVTVALPRTRVIDHLVEIVLEKMRIKPPDEGTSILVPIPRVPVGVNLVKSAGHWVLTSDPSVMTGWASHERGGWSDSPAGRLALEKASSAAVAIGSSDTPMVLRLISGWGAQLGLANLSERERNQLVSLLARLANVAKPGYLAVTDDEKGLEAQDRALMGLWMIPTGGIPAATMHSAAPLKAPDAGGIEEAAAQLRDVIMPAEAAFQAKKIMDRNHDGRGEYGLLSELGGARQILGAEAQHFVPANLASGAFDGWHYEVFIPDGHDGGMGEPEGQNARTVDEGAAAAQERHWVAYAWPDDPTRSNRMLALLPDGVVRSATYTPGDVPEWSDVFGGGNSWEAKPAWAPLEQGPGAGSNGR